MKSTGHAKLQITVTSDKGLSYSRKLFDKPFDIIKTGYTKRIVRLLCIPMVDDTSVVFEENRPYQKCQYVSITAGGSLVSWPSNFEHQHTYPLYANVKQPLPYSHKIKVTITDMLYIKELNELVVSSSEGELLFYFANLSPPDFWVKHCLIDEEGQVTNMHYWSDGSRAVFSFGDSQGFIYIFTTSDIHHNYIFDKSLFTKNKHWTHPTAFASTLVNANTTNNQCICVRIFRDEISSVKFINELDAIAVCSSSSEKMVLLSFSFDHLKDSLTKKIFKSGVFSSAHLQFSCVVYCSMSWVLATGGTDGVVRLWSPKNTSKCVEELKAQDTKITHLVYNIEEQILVSISLDLKVCVWRETEWVCTQTIIPEGLKTVPRVTITYNSYNNELFLANTEIARCLGKGTKPLKKSVAHHLKPISSVIYHQDSQRVVSVSEGGLVSLWNLEMEKAVMQFMVMFDHREGSAAFLFDESRKKLITVSPDGAVRTWTFRNGHQLKILYPELPSEPTGFIRNNNRLFVSVKNNSNVFVLEMEGEDHRIWHHDLLKDIADIDTHQDLLITASSQGNVVIWDVTTEEVCFYIIGGDFPQLFMATEDYQGYRDTLNVRTMYFAQSFQTPVSTDGYLVTFLKTREESLHTATVLTASQGYVFAWSLKYGLFVKFAAVTEEGATITSWTMDPKEHRLITGDSTGRLCLWDIETFAVEGYSLEGPFLAMAQYSVSICPPLQLNVWQLERSPIKSVVCDEDCQKVIAAGLMGKLTVFTNVGSCAKSFGKDCWEKTELLTPRQRVPTEWPPADTEKCFSGNTNQQKLKLKKIGQAAQRDLEMLHKKYCQVLENTE